MVYNSKNILCKFIVKLEMVLNLLYYGILQGNHPVLSNTVSWKQICQRFPFYFVQKILYDDSFKIVSYVLLIKKNS